METLTLWFQDFEFNASMYYIFRWIGFKIVGWNMIATIGKILPLLIILSILLLTFFKKNRSTPQLVTTLLFGVSIYFVFSTTVHPWYIASPLLLSVFTKYKFATIWSFFVMLSYGAYSNDITTENLWLVALEYLAVIGFFVWEVNKFRKKSLIRTNS